jgi:hypothetical protein
MRPRLACSILLLLVTGIPAAAVYAVHPHELEQARRALEHAEVRRSHALAALEASGHAIGQATSARDATIHQLRGAVAAIQGLEHRLTEAEAAMRAAEQTLSDIDRQLEGHRLAHADAGRAAAEAGGIVQQMRADAEPQLRQAPEWVEAEAAIAQEQRRLAELVEESARRLAADPQHEQLDLEVQWAEAHLKSLRIDPRAIPRDLAAASQAWLDARSRAVRYRQAWQDADPVISAARAALEAAFAGQRLLVESFEASLEADPAMRDARQRLEHAERVMTHAAENLGELAGWRDATHQHIERLQHEIHAGRAQLGQARHQAESLQHSIRWAEDAIDRAGRDYERAAAHHAWALRDRDTAECRYRDLYEQYQREQERYRRERETHDRGERYDRGVLPAPDRHRPHEPQGGSPPHSGRPVPPREDSQRQADDARRAEREQREADWQKRREENRRNQQHEREKADQAKQRPPESKDKPEPSRFHGPVQEPPPKKEAPAPQRVHGPEPQKPPQPKKETPANDRVHGPQPEQPRPSKQPDNPTVDKKHGPQPVKPEVSKPDPKKPEESKDRGDRYRGGK